MNANKVPQKTRYLNVILILLLVIMIIMYLDLGKRDRVSKSLKIRIEQIKDSLETEERKNDELINQADDLQDHISELKTQLNESVQNREKEIVYVDRKMDQFKTLEDRAKDSLIYAFIRDNQEPVQ